MKEEDLKRAEIKAAVEKELGNVEQMIAELGEYKEQNSRAFRRAKASVLHDFYNCCERVFKIIAQEINRGIQESLAWHKGLLYRMTAEIEGVRPSVVSERLAADLDEYLSFRHIFRNIYGFELESDRLDRLVEKFADVATRFLGEIRGFLRSI